MKKNNLLGVLAMVGALNPESFDILNDQSIKKEMKKILNQKDHKNRGTRIEPRTEPKIGRNELCPCGGGKKYKNCCLKNN